MYSEVLRDSGVGILFQWHYMQETDNYAHLDSGVSILFQWHYTRETDTILNWMSLGTLAWAFYYNGTTRERPTTMLNRTLAWAFYSSSTHLQFERLRDFQNLLSDRFQEKFQEKCRFQESAHAGGQKTCSSYPSQTKNVK